jgi:serine protease Do
VTWRRPARDLARLQVRAGELPAVEHRDSSTIRPGELVVAVGNPFGFSGALSAGVVNGTGTVRGLGPQSWILANVRLAPGCSGGPLADAEGRVIGINTMALGGLGLAVPSNAVVSLLREGPRGVRLGVVLRPTREGLLTLEVAPGSGAEAASLLPGDLLVGVDGRPIASVGDLQQALDRPNEGVLEVEFRRGGASALRRVRVRLGQETRAEVA